MKTCPRCGVENKSEKAACWNCWAPLEGPAGAAPRPTTRRLALTIPWTAVTVVGLVLLAVAGTYFLLLASKPVDVAKEYLRAVRNGNEEKWAQLSTRSTSGQSLLPKTLLLANYEVAREGGPPTNGQVEVPVTLHLMVDAIEIGMERAMLSDVVMEHLKQHPARVNMVLVKEGLSWHVDQNQTQQRVIDAALGGLPPAIKNQLIGAKPLPPAPSSPAPEAPVSPSAPPKPSPAGA